MSNVVQPPPAGRITPLDQLRAFVAVEQDRALDKTHIAAWALSRIEELEARLAAIEAQEPVAWMYEAGEDYLFTESKRYSELFDGSIPLYTNKIGAPE